MRIARFTTGEDPVYGLVDGAGEKIAEITGDPLYTKIELTGATHLVADVRLLAPVIPRSKVIGIGRNYADHAKEMGGEAPSTPLMFLIPNTAVVGPGDPVVIPGFTQEVSYEGELAVIIGRVAKDVPVDQALSVVFGYTVANDVTARDLQRGDGQWARAKGLDTFCPLGPWIETSLDPAGLPDPHDPRRRRRPGRAHVRHDPRRGRAHRPRLTGVHAPARRRHPHGHSCGRRSGRRGSARRDRDRPDRHPEQPLRRRRVTPGGPTDMQSCVPRVPSTLPRT